MLPTVGSSHIHSRWNEALEGKIGLGKWVAVRQAGRCVADGHFVCLVILRGFCGLCDDGLEVHLIFRYHDIKLLGFD